MSNDPLFTRRQVLRGVIAGAGAGLLVGCDSLSQKERFINVLSIGETLNQRVQRFLTGDSLAKEYSESMISPVFRANGSTNPQTDEYLAMKANGFSDYRLKIGGLVDNPLELGLDAIRAMPSRTQITRHDCVEGWSVIGKWAGVPLAHLLDTARVKPGARYVVFYCFDDYGDNGGRYYESIDLLDAYHPQTMVAHSLNNEPLGVPNGAPLRMRIERKLGYKQPKYLRMIEVVDSYAAIQGGKGGYWEDNGYDWYGGI